MAKRNFKIGDRVTVTDKSDRVYGMTGTIVDYCGGSPLNSVRELGWRT